MGSDVPKPIARLAFTDVGLELRSEREQWSAP